MQGSGWDERTLRQCLRTAETIDLDVRALRRTIMKKRNVPNDGDELPIRNSTAEFLVFAKENAVDTIAVRSQDKMLEHA